MKYLITIGTLLGVWMVAAELFIELPAKYFLPITGITSVLWKTAGMLLTYLATAAVAEWMRVKKWRYHPNGCHSCARSTP